MTLKHILFILAAIVFAGCAKNTPPVDYTTMEDDELHAVADSLAHAFIITDTHVDLPYRLKIKNFRLEREFLGIPISTTEGDFDYERSKKGGLDAPFMSRF